MTRFHFDEAGVERTGNGDQVLRDVPREGVDGPAIDGPLREALEEAYDAAFGGEAMVLHEIVSIDAHIDVYVYPPTSQRPYWVLATMGMSDAPQDIPEEAGLEFDRCEILITLPWTWQGLDLESGAMPTAMGEERWYWPIRWLKMIAHMPTQLDTWFWYGHSMPNDDPIRPMVPGIELAGAVLGFPHALPNNVIPTPSGPVVVFGLYFVTEAELDFKLAHGTDALMEHLDREGIWEGVPYVTRGSVDLRA